MYQPLTTARFFAILIGTLLLIQGIWNLVDPPFLGIFTSNFLHALIHVVLGIIGIWTGVKAGAYTFNLFLGIILLTVGLLYYVEAAREYLDEIFGINEAVALLNIGIGTLCLLVVVTSKKPVRRVTPE